MFQAQLLERARSQRRRIVLPEGTDAFGVMNACWGVGALVGPAAGGALAGVAGDTVPYLVLAGVCVATYLATRARYAEPVGELP